MLLYTRFVLRAGILAALFVSLMFPAAASAQTGNWEYVEDLGGWLDWDTGLVWGSVKAAVSWNTVQSTYLPQYRAATGISDWRMPTVAELQTASANGIYNVLVGPTFPPNGLPGFPAWSSETVKKKVKGVEYAYFVTPFNGSVGQQDKRVNYGFIPVYQAFAP
jgi:hypothetical protein